LHFEKEAQLSIPDRWDTVEEPVVVDSSGLFLSIIIESHYVGIISLQARKIQGPEPTIAMFFRHLEVERRPFFTT
jgi:hypothetical protein